MIFEIIIETAVHFIAEVVFYGTGRFLLFAFLGDRARIQDYTEEKSRLYAKAFRRDGQIMYFSDDLVILAGMLFYILLAVLAYFIFR